MNMICRHYQKGQTLDVAGLNEITVLIDRSETQRTEVGWNRWRKGLEGPPHSHDAKEQVFYVTDGLGTVVVGEARYAVRPGSLIYVPPGTTHQTIVTGAETLSYLLFNAFLDAGKEGHASFADHIDKVKQVRRHQAQVQQAAVAGAESRGNSAGFGRCIDNINPASVPNNDSTEPTRLLERSETRRCQVSLVTCSREGKPLRPDRSDQEQTWFVLSGRGRVTVADDTAEVSAGDVVFVPVNAPYTMAANDAHVNYLCFNTLVTEVFDSRKTPTNSLL
ncbi:MAG: cupin domain-containing protein [Phycisphaeraceae bacterium]|nr:cupin domain-containing protein [Phycisphaeraceae bacterium]